MINLFDIYDEKTVDLKRSLDAAGYKNTTVLLEDNGFLDDDVTSPFAFFTKMYDNHEKNVSLFFNEVKTPYYWEIRADSRSADIFDGYHKKGHIVYSTREDDFRAVKEVEWFNDVDKLRQVDMYNKYGQMFAKRTYSDGDLTLTTYFDDQLREVVLVNHIAKTIQVNYQQKQHIFNDMNDFIIFYFKCAQLNTDRIFYNSLSTPYFVASRLSETKTATGQVLFWQEDSTEMPGNMRMLLDNKSTNNQVIVQDRQEYTRLKQQSKSDDKLTYLGYIYDYNENTSLNKQAFVLTNSDNIANLEQIVQALPDWEIQVAAFTEMSPKLMGFAKYENVKLFPNATVAESKDMINNCSIYLDINHGGQVNNIVRRTFDNNKMIISFAGTTHNAAFMNEKNIIGDNQPESLVARMQATMQDYDQYKNALSEQRYAAGQATVDEYKRELE